VAADDSSASSVNHGARSDAAAAADAVDDMTPLIGAYVGGTLAILFTLLVVNGVISYYVAARKS